MEDSRFIVRIESLATLNKVEFDTAAGEFKEANPSSLSAGAKIVGFIPSPETTTYMFDINVSEKVKTKMLLGKGIVKISLCASIFLSTLTTMTSGLWLHGIT